MIYFESNIYKSPTAKTHLNQEDCKIAIPYYVDRCDEYGIRYSRETEGAMIVIPDMFGTWAVGYFIGPEYIFNNRVRFATEQEMCLIAKSLGFELFTEFCEDCEDCGVQ